MMTGIELAAKISLIVNALIMTGISLVSIALLIYNALEKDMEKKWPKEEKICVFFVILFSTFATFGVIFSLLN